MKIQFFTQDQAQELQNQNITHFVFLLHGKEMSESLQKIDQELDGQIQHALDYSNMEGKFAESICVFGNEIYQKITLLSLGEKSLKSSQFGQIGGHIAQHVFKDEKAAIFLPSQDKYQDLDIPNLIAQGVSLGSWRFMKYKTEENHKPSQLKALYMEAGDLDKSQKNYQLISSITEGTNVARDLVSEPGNQLYPESFKDRALELESLGCEVKVFDYEALKAKGMNAIVSVGQGSKQKPYMVVIKWKGDETKDPLALVGKGVTFDTGGISIKPSAGMEDMIFDMGGAASVFGVMKSLALRKSKSHVIGILGLAENMPSSSATRPGDVITAYSGKTVEIMNTDAEGRLVMADCITYAQKDEHAKQIIDLATLTGAMLVALGTERAGLFTNDEDWAKSLFDAGEETGDLLWHFPVGSEYDSHIKTRHADIKNTGKGRYGGAISAAKFLEAFVEEGTKWAHLDIAPTAWLYENKMPYVKGASGFGVRLLNQWIMEHYEE